MSKDYYNILGVEKGASKEDIKKAYKKLARKYHPDISKETDAEQKFKDINEAAGILLDDEKKQRYDTYGSADGPQGFGGGGGGFNPQDFGINLDDIFEQFGFGGGGFGGRRSSRPQRKDTRVHTDVELTLDESYKGVSKELSIRKDVSCDECSGSGSKDPNDIDTCSTCQGSGVVIEMQRSILGAIRTQRVCSACQGRGKTVKNPCSNCHGEGSVHKTDKLEITIPKGVESGMTLRVPGKGSYDRDSQEYGDLFVEVLVKRHKSFDVEGADLYMQLDINFIQAILGDEVDIEHFEKTLSLKIPTGTQSGTVLRLKNKGMPHMNYNGSGDLYVKINVEVPTKVSQKQKDLLLEYAKTLKDKGFLKRVKDLFK